MNAEGRTLLRAGLAGYLIAAAAGRAFGQPNDAVPKETEGVGVTEHPGAVLPLELMFRDENGRDVRLKDYFAGSRPVILTLNYYRCPMLCTLQLNGLVDALRRMEWTPGRQFEIVTVSIDPLETPPLARLKKQNYMKEYGRPEAAKGWHFLTGREENIRRLAATVGFEYRYDRETDQYVHAAALFVCTPEGRVSRYLYGILYDPTTLRLSLVEAAEGRTRSTVDRILLYCFHYDSAKGRYAPAAMNLMRAGGVATVLILGGVLAAYWRREAARRKASSGAAAAGG